jgi:hypothetical protein
MTDRIFLRLDARLALGADSLQWILYSSIRKDGAPSLELRHWRPVSFVSSSRDILLRCTRESGFGEHTAVLAVESLHPTFAAWKAAQSTPCADSLASAAA